MKTYLSVALAVLVMGCQKAPENEPEMAAKSAPEPVVESAQTAMLTATDRDRLAATLAAQPEEVQARYQYRNPQETLEFFGIKPGMTVVEGLPGGGWYTKMLLPYLGAEGKVIGANYSLEMYPLFSFANEAFMVRQRAWLTDWVVGAEEWRGDDGATLGAFHFGSMPDEIAGTADAVLFVRVLHNLVRFESEGDFLTAALTDSYNALKPGGIFGVVQHCVGDSMSDTFADGSNGYLKEAMVIAMAEQAGFELLGQSTINANPADQPGETDIVWRLPPSLVTSGNDAELKAQLMAIGESNRMTLKFRKPL